MMTVIRRLCGPLCFLVLAGTNCPAETLRELLDGGSLTVLDKRFSDWSLIFQDGTVTPDLSQIQVVGLAGDPLNPGLLFQGNGQLVVSDFGFLTLEFQYTISTTTGAATIKDNSLDLDAYELSGEGGNLLITEDLVGQGGVDLGNKLVEVDSEGTTVVSDMLNFSPQSEIVVKTGLTLEGDAPGDLVRIVEFSQRFSQIPEPMSLATFAGLASIGLLAARRRRVR